MGHVLQSIGVRRALVSSNSSQANIQGKIDGATWNVYEITFVFSAFEACGNSSAQSHISPPLLHEEHDSHAALNRLSSATIFIFVVENVVIM